MKKSLVQFGSNPLLAMISGRKNPISATRSITSAEGEEILSCVLLNNQKMAPYLDIFKYTLLVTNYL